MVAYCLAKTGTITCGCKAGPYKPPPPSLLPLGCFEGVLPLARREQIWRAWRGGIRDLTLELPGDLAAGWGSLSRARRQAWKMEASKQRKRNEEMVMGRRTVSR